MEKVQFPRFMVAAEKSGQGKTLITCALLELLKEQHRVSAFKCGPDYIDPMFHRRVAGVPSYNLDSFFSSREELIQLLGLHGGPDRLGVIEGVMGYYDGLGGSTDRASSYEVAERTHTPVILVADAQGRSFSTLAAVRGFLNFRPDSHIKGVLFNRLSPMLYPALKRAAEEELGIRAVGFVPPLGEEFRLKSRHLGLLRPEEIPGFREEIHRLAKALRPGIDLEAILSIAKEAEPLPARRRRLPQIRKENGEKPVIAVAMDEAFCFYYQDNLETLEAMNAELRFFSPIHDEKVPGEADGLYLGGGYPELYGKELSENASMRASVRELLAQGMPCIAECGGYLYLKQELADADGISWPMCGVLPGGSRDSGRLSRFGYGIMTAMGDSVLGSVGTSVPAHEFHHWDSPENGDCFSFKKPVGTREWSCGYGTESLYAGFPHLYFYGHEPVRFLELAARRRDGECGRSHRT